MSPRKEFLLALFKTLEANNVPYCVARNYDDLYTSTDSDVDLVVEAENIRRFEDCLHEAATASNHFEALRAAYANLSYVFLHTTGTLLRIDVETETRWRIFPILSAQSIVALRRRLDEFFIPHPRHESVILFAAALWRNSVSTRYRKQLARLYFKLSQPEQFRRTYRSIFSELGNGLADYQANALKENFGCFPFKALKKRLIVQSLRIAPIRRAMWDYFISDLRRYVTRAFHPPGVALVFASSARQPWKIEPLLERMEFLFPGGKTNLVFINEEKTIAGVDLKSRFDRWKTLFKGGLYIRFYKVADERNIGRIVARHSKLAWPSRTFIWSENSRAEAALAHISTGFMKQFDSVSEGPAVGTAIISFIAKMLNWTSSNSSGKPGAFVVLLGLDGSGKTTIARELCCRAARGGQFQNVNYFHWRPSLSGKPLFPFSTTTNIPRKPGRQKGIVISLLSSLRLFKNLALTRLAWTFSVRSKLRNGTLVIMDRYFYNYYLDPASVRYYGPTRLVDKLRGAFPQPDLIVVLKAPIETLLRRKQELSPEEIQRQSAVLEQISREAPASMAVDATRPPSEIASEIFSRLAVIRGIEPHFPLSK